MDVMISYSHDNTDVMRIIKEELKRCCISVWVDEDGLNAGVDFLSKIGQAVVECHIFLSIVTEASLTSKYCKDEVNLAYISKRPMVAFSVGPKTQLFNKMDFGQKLTFSAVKFIEVKTQTDDGYKSAAALLSKHIQGLLSQLNSFHQKDNDSSKSQSASSEKRDQWVKLEKFRRQISSTSSDDVTEVIFDIKPKLFWDDCIGYHKNEVPWEVFEEKIKEKFKDQLEKFCTGEHDADWFMAVIKGEIGHADDNDDSFVSKDRLLEFCASGKDNRLWQSISSYAAEYSAIREVFSLQSTVRLDAINKLKEYNSKAAQETLMDLTRDSDPNVRATAAVTLAKVTEPGDKKVSDRLGLLLKDKDRLVRESACVALGRIKADDKVNDLVKVWRNEVISSVRDAAFLALQHIDSEEAKEAIHITKILADEIKLLTT